MTFRNIRFPTGIRFGAQGGPRWMNDRVRLNSGRVIVNKNQIYPLRRFQMARALKDDDTRNAFLAFIHVIAGADRFRFKDWSDYRVISGEGVFTSLGADQYQLVKRYSVDALTAGSPTTLYTYDEDIVLPLSGTISIAGLTENTDWSTDYTTPSGVITLLGSPTPATPTSWTGQFDRHVMFDTDAFDLQWGEGEVFEAVSVVIEEQPV